GAYGVRAATASGSVRLPRQLARRLADCFGSGRVVGRFERAPVRDQCVGVLPTTAAAGAEAERSRERLDVVTAAPHRLTDGLVTHVSTVANTHLAYSLGT